MTALQGYINLLKAYQPPATPSSTHPAPSDGQQGGGSGSSQEHMAAARSPARLLVEGGALHLVGLVLRWVGHHCCLGAGSSCCGFKAL